MSDTYGWDMASEVGPFAIVRVRNGFLSKLVACIAERSRVHCWCGESWNKGGSGYGRNVAFEVSPFHGICRFIKKGCGVEDDEVRVGT